MGADLAIVGGRSYDEAQAAEVLDLLHARGLTGILSTESVEIGIPGLQQRVGELRESGWPIKSVRQKGTRLVRYVLPPGSVRGEAESPIVAGCRIVRREDGSVTVLAYVEGDGSDDLAERVTDLIPSLWPDEPDVETRVETQAEPEPMAPEPLDYATWLIDVCDTPVERLFRRRG